MKMTPWTGKNEVRILEHTSRNCTFGDDGREDMALDDTYESGSAMN